MPTTEERLEALEARNRRVEADKGWETSLERRAAILVLTYIVVSIFLTIIGTPHAWVSAIVPSLGFLLSTLTITVLKQNWLKRKHHKED